MKNGIKKTLEEFVIEAQNIHGNNFDYSEVEYINAKTKIKIKCNKCQEYFLQTPDSHINKKSGCPYCIGQNKTTEKFIQKANEIHKNIYNYIQVKYISAHKKVKIYCNKCHTFFEQTPANHLSGHGCPYCSYKQNSVNYAKTQEQFIIDAKKIHKNSYNYSKTNYINNNIKIEIICKKCGKSFWQTPSKHLSGHGCPYCSKSHGENKIQYILEKYNINYEIQKRFKDCKDKKPLPFDFYLPDLNICIEYQGRQHYKEGLGFFIAKRKSKELGIEDYKKQKLHDKIKKQYCKKHNIKLLEIKYCDNIEKKLNSIIKSVK